MKCKDCKNYEGHYRQYFACYLCEDCYTEALVEAWECSCFDKEMWLDHNA